MKLPEIKFEKYSLSNGLQVILHEDHAIPTVAVNVWYHVGSKNEKRGRTGFAHLFEHMMFEGSQHNPSEFFEPLERVGANLNGSTSEDRTNYWEHLPSNYLELALWMEADRMGFLLPALDQEKLDNQIDVVQNERRQRVDNQPYGRVYEVMLEAMYPYDHPYSWPVNGSMEDIAAATLDDVKAFFTRFYTPNNASLCIAGAFDSAVTKKWIETYFGDIPTGPPVERIETWVSNLDAEKRMLMEDNVALPRIYLGWHTPPLHKPGDAELDILANILSSGKNSRLYKSLVYEKQIAQDVTAHQGSNEIGSTFQIVATAKPGHSLQELEAGINEELEKILKEPPGKEEVETAINGWEARFIRLLQSNGGFGGKADLLNQYNTFVGRPDYFQEDLNRYMAVTPGSVQAFAGDFIQLDKRVVINVQPLGKPEAKTKSSINRSRRPGAGVSSALELPLFQESGLSNGLSLFVAEQHNLPLIQFNLVINAGWAADHVELPGVSNVTSDLLDEGTLNRDALQISQELKSIGAFLSSSSHFDANSVTINTLKQHLDKALDVFADVVLNPTFPEEELARRKKILQARILQEKSEPFISSLKAHMRKLYGKEHPYGQPYTGSGTEESIEAIVPENLREFYQHYFRPNNAILIVVGDVTLDEISPHLERRFAEWPGSEVHEPTIPSVKSLKKPALYVIDKPGAVQSVIVIGHVGQARNTPDYYKLEVMDTLLGGKFTSRINMNLREDKGFTYGAKSMFILRKAEGPFLAYAQVHGEHTAESVFELMKELRGIRGEIPVTAEELKDTKDNLILGYPREFETIGNIANKIAELVIYDLPRDTFERYIPGIESVSAEDVREAAQKHIRPNELLIVVLGDRKKIEPGLRELKLGEIGYLDGEGNEV